MNPHPREGEFDLVPISKVLEDRSTIVADRRKPDPLLLKSCLCILQLHELRFAERSPVRRTEKEKDRSSRTSECLIGLLSTKLIRQAE